MTNIYSESGRNIHRLTAIILAVTTWITVYNLSPTYFIPFCIITAGLEFSAYKTLSNRTIGDNPAYYYAAVAITVASSLFSLAAGFVVESSIQNRTAAVAVAQSEQYSESATRIMESNQRIVDNFQADKDRQIERINARYDRYQDEIGTIWWKRDFEKNPQAYRRYSADTNVGRWVRQRDSLEQARDKAIASVEAEMIGEGLLADIPEDFSTSTMAAGKVLSIASRYTIIIIDVFCLIIMIGIMQNEQDEEREGMTDALMVAPILIGRAIRRQVDPVVVEEERKDVELEEKLLEKEKMIADLKKQVEQGSKRLRKEAAPENDEKKETLVKVKNGKIVVGNRKFSSKKSLQTAISRERQRGNEEKVRKLEEALEEYSRKHFPHLSSPGGN